MEQQLAYVGHMRVPVPPNLGIFRCAICGADIGTFDPAEIRIPFRAGMFKAIGPGFPSPIRSDPRYPSLDCWEWASCPICRKRPFIHRDAIMTPAGLFKVGDDALPRKRTPAQAEAERRQEQLEAIWTEQGLDIHEEITMRDLREMYPSKGQSELNQLMIDMQWEEDEAPGYEEETEETVHTETQAVSEPRPQAKRGRGRPRKFRRVQG